MKGFLGDELRGDDGRGQRHDVTVVCMTGERVGNVGEDSKQMRGKTGNWGNGPPRPERGKKTKDGTCIPKKYSDFWPSRCHYCMCD
jgi:hypothetical protein